MEKKSFLLEIGVEELPVSYVRPALAQLERDLKAWLGDERLDFGETRAFATPRRLALRVEGLDLAQEDLDETVTGPPVKAAFRDGAPTAAAEGFARGLGLSVDELRTVETPKGEYLAGRKLTPGRPAAEILAEGLPERILALRFPKTMTWGDGALRFARPIRWVAALLGEDVLPFTLGSLRAGRETRGHSRLAPGGRSLPGAADYEKVLAEAQVEPDVEARKADILRLAEKAAAGMGGRLVPDEELLETVTFLVEKGAALAGSFAEEFLRLPREVVTVAMKAHQRYFSVEDEGGNLLPGFVVITNGPVSAPEVVRAGNEKVLQARLEDARFYWEEDGKSGLDGLNAKLETVLWLEGFGSLAERGERLRGLSARVAELLEAAGARDLPHRETLDWAARYAKADLASEMVKDGKEFTKLQGYMGQQYALRDGAPAAAADALYEHYFPRSAGDRLPEGSEGAALALADRMDAIAGFWGGGFAPTGSKDPYALRRQALAVLRILIGKEWPLALADLVDGALAGYPRLDVGALRPALLTFFFGRLETLLEDRGVAPDIFRAVQATGETSVLALHGRALELNALRGDEAFEKLVRGARRVDNILAKEKRSPAAGDRLEHWERGELGEPTFRKELLSEGPEADLHAAFRDLAPVLAGHARRREFGQAYRKLAGLGPAIDAYFDGVMVLVPEEEIRENRLALLCGLSRLFGFFAGLHEVVLEGEREGNSR